MIVDVLADVLLGSMFYWLSFFYTGFALGVFLVRAHEAHGPQRSRLLTPAARINCDIGAPC